MRRRIDIAGLLSEAAELSQQSASLAAQNRVAEALDLERKADRLRAKARRAASRSENVNRANSADGSIAPGLGQDQTERGESVRAVTVAALGEIGVPTSPRAVAEYAWARFGTTIDHRALASLRRDESRAWSSPRSARAVYIVPALEGRRFVAVRGKVALSEWPLERRLIGPWSERVDHLAATIQLARQLEWLTRMEPSAAERLRGLLSVYAATVRGAYDQTRPLDPHRVEEAARAELDVLGTRDADWRSEAAERAQRVLNEQQLLWGASILHAVVGNG